jgi:cystathionine beta-lyase family protein involved in aluminum resistance
MKLSSECLRLINDAEQALTDAFHELSERALNNQQKMLDAFQTERIRTHHFQSSTGYGYHDIGRDALERVFARVFRAESALVRQQLVSGTHAIACALLGNLRHDQELILASGPPYETLLGVLGIPADYDQAISETGGFLVKIVPLANGSLDIPKIAASITEKTKIVAFQRSCGYSERHSFSIAELETAFDRIKTIRPDIIIFVDNCYGEFVEENEPLEVGADLIAGSLIKNPGGCLIPSGGYIAGRSSLVKKSAERLYAPKIGGEIGPSLLNLQLFFQGFFEAPHRVSEMLKGAILASQLFQRLGLKVSPLPEEKRSDIIQKIYFNSAPDLIEFCRLIQQNSPIESDVHPEPALLPGYVHRVIIGGGTFVSGSTSELSVDAPIKSPYIAFLQGGLSYTQIKLVLARAIEQRFLSSNHP